MDIQPKRALSDGERLDWLRLIRSENVGPITFYQLLRHYGSAGEALKALPELSRRGGRRRPIKASPKGAAEAEIEEVARLGARLVGRSEPEYPEPLAAIEDAPPLVAVLGSVHLLARRMIAVVGARNASANGRRFAARLAADLTEAGLVVVSGLARGIDAEAHRGALAQGTVAVVAGGVDIPYPNENAELYDRIVAEGAVLSEQPPGTTPQGRHFPPRNRLISGLSLGVVVVEAAPRSGSLITARMALEQGREVMAVPGSPLDPRCRGANNLIRQGATLTESAEDVLRALAGQLRAPLAEPRETAFAPSAQRPPDEDEIDRARPIVIEYLGPAPVTMDEIVRQSGLAPAVIATVLLELELAGRLDRHPGQQVSLSME